MSEEAPRRSATLQIATEEHPFPLECGETLAPVRITYETYGRLDADHGNAVLICHALTGSAHAASSDEHGTRGWWDDLIGPGRAIDTDRWFVICSNVLGGCYGSTGPASIDLRRGTRYGERFPTITVRDIVRAQRLLLLRIGIERLHAVIGGSMGGMQALEWGLLFPDHVGRLVPIATSARHSAWCVGFNAVAREALRLGRAADDVDGGLRLARKVAMLTYRSDLELAERFGRETAREGTVEAGDGFAIESWLEHHGRTLVSRFDADSYRVLTRAMDLHDITAGRGDLAATLGALRQPMLSIGITSDVLYPVREQREIARLAPRGLYREIDSPHGHDAFLIETAQLGRHLAWFLAAESFDECSDERYDCTGAASAQHTSRTLTRQVA
jgi:homoserine O-acetyltransferase